MKKRSTMENALAFAAMCLLCFSAEALEVAGSLVVDLNMSNVTGVSEGGFIGVWANQATGSDKVGNFVPVNAGAGGVFSRAAHGVPAVLFNGNADSVMWCSDALPATVVGSDSWTAEVWICNPSLTQGIETFFSWTYRGSGNKCMEMRYGTDNGNAIEHYGNNIGWNGVPVADVWHHVVITRDGSGNEALYVDGAKRITKDAYTALDIPTGGNFHIGGVKNGSSTGGFDGNMFFSGYIAAIRVHTDGLTAEQVWSNYAEESFAYQNVWGGSDGLWSEGGNWLGGSVPTDAAAFSQGGTATITGDVALKMLNLASGTVKVDGGSFAFTGQTGTIILNGGVLPSSLDVASGAFTSQDAPVEGATSVGTFTLRVGTPGAADDTATALFNKGLNLAHGGVANLVLEDGVAMTVNGWFRGAFAGGSTFNFVMNGGSLVCTDWFLIATDGGSGEVTINDGHFLCPGFEFTYAGNTDAQSGLLHLNGGTLELNRFQNNNMAGTQAISFNGGTLKARQTNGNFLENRYEYCTVGARGATFDVPSNFAVDVKNLFTVDSASPGGAIVKTGTGRINFAEAFNYAGPITVSEGSCKFNALANFSSVTTLSVAPGAIVLCSEAGGVQALVAKLPADCAGTVLITPECAADNIDLTGHPNVKIGYSGTFAFTGTITYDQAATPVYSFVQNQGVVNVQNALVDLSGKPTALEASGFPGDGFKIVLLANSTFTGGITVDSVMLQSDVAGGFGTTGAIRLVNGGELVLNHADIDVQGLIDRITPDSVGSLLFCANSKKDVSFSLVGHPGLYVGSYPGHHFTYTGTITFDGSEAHFGGGRANYTIGGSGFVYQPAGGMSDAATEPRTVVGGRPGVFGLGGDNPFTGNVVVTNGATIFFRNCPNAYGATTGAVDPAHFYFNDGNIRNGDQSTVFPERFGVTVDADGMKMHLWSNSTLTFLGSVHGTGPMAVSDNGRIVFGGTANDYAGAITVRDSAQFQIGSDLGFSWDFDHAMPALGNAARLILYVRDGDTLSFAHSVPGGYLGKEGAGRLVLAAAQATLGTVVSGGTLAVDADGIISGDLTVEANGTFEIDGGATVTVGALNGAGLITAPEGTTARLAFTGGTFSGTVAPNVTLVKIGAGRAELIQTGTCCAFEVQEGTLAVDAAAIAHPVVAPGATLELMSSGRGLLGKYYSGVNALADWKNIISTLARMEEFEASREAEATGMSSAFGGTFVVHGQNQLYPGDFGSKDYWIGIWRGYLWIDKNGTYGFGTASDDGSSVFIDGKMVVSNIKDQGWNDDQFNTTYQKINLARGWHEIVIGFYDATGGNDIGVKVTPPGGTAEFLSNAQLFPTRRRETVIEDDSDVQGGLRLGGGVPRLVFNVPAETTSDLSGSFSVDETHGEIVKAGEGTLVYSLHGQGSPKNFSVSGGTLALVEATNVGALDIASGARVTVSPKRTDGYRGLALNFFDSTDNSYTSFQTLPAFRDYFYGGAAILGNTWDFGWGKLCSDPVNEACTSGWRFLGKYCNADNFHVGMTGYIYLPYDGEYAFGFRSDDGVVLYIDGERYYYYTGVTTGADNNNGGWKAYTAGLHKFELAFRENGGGQYLSVFIRARTAGGTGTFDRWANWEILPQELLFPEFSYADGLSGSGALDLGEGEFWVDAVADFVFGGTLSGEASSCFVKGGDGMLALTGALASFDGMLAVAGGTLALSPAEDVDLAGGIALEAGTTFVVDSSKNVVFAGELAGSGTFVVDGGACVTVARSDHFTGEVKVKNGRFLVAADAASGAQGYRLLAGHGATVGVATGTADVVLPEVASDDQLFNEKYFRFTVKRTYGDTIVQLSEFSLYDKDGVRQNLNLAKSTGVDASTIAPGEFWASPTYSWGGNGSEGPGNLFDANTATKACLGAPAPTDENDSSKYCVITMRLADSANPVATYSFTTANDSTPARSPSYWMLEASRDGVNWKTIDEKTNWRSGPTSTFTETERFTHAKTAEANEGDLVENVVSVAVASGSEARIYGPAVVSLEGGAATPTGLERLETDDFAKWTFTEQAQADYDALGANGFWILYGEADKAGSAFLTERVDVARPWRVTFTYQARTGASTEWADGIAFCIHNEAEGAAFCDTTRLGGALAGAAAGHATCAAFWFNLYQKENCGWAIGGTKFETPDEGNLSSTADRFIKDGYNVEIMWDGHKLVGRVWHKGALLTTLEREVDMASVVGAGASDWDGKATLGFIGATGGSAAKMYIRDLRVYTTRAEAVATSVSVPADTAGALKVFADETALSSVELGAGASLTFAANGAMKGADLDYAVTVASLKAAGNAQVALDSNGAGVGTLKLGELWASGGTVAVEGGIVTAADGTITIVIPDTAPDGVINLVTYYHADWQGPEPRFNLVGDTPEATKYRYYRGYARGGRIFVVNRLGTTLLFR